MTKSPPTRKRFTRIASLLLTASLAVPMLLGNMTAYAADADDTPTQVSSFQWKYPKNPSFEEINQYAADHPFDVDLPDSYDIKPDIANEEINTRIGTDTSALVDAKGKADRDKLAGCLTQETLDNALNATNFMRVHAGLQTLYIHTNDKIGGYQWRAQAGAALMAELNSVTHNVSGAAATEAGIVNGVFGWAKAGPGGSNIVAGNGVANKMVNSFMPDIGNDRTGLSHRSYILNPALSGTGFGAADLSGTTNYKTGKARGSAVAIFVTYFGADPDGLSAVLWPSRKQPIETFQARGTWTMQYPEGNPYQGNPWSYFINTNDVSVDTNTLKVTLTCDGKPTDVLDFNNLTATEKSENRLFTISSFPLKKLVAWRPHVAYGVGDKVTVNIEGLVDSQGLPVPVEYDVHFFKTGTVPYPNLTDVAADRTAPETASVDFTSDYAGTLHYLLLDADAPVPTAGEVLDGTELALNEGAIALDFTALTGSNAKKVYYITTSTSGAGKDYATANANGEMSTVKSVDIPAYTAPTMTLTDAAAIRTGTSRGAVTFTAPVAGTYYYVVRDAAETSCEKSVVLAGAQAAMAAGENRIDLTALTNNEAKSVFLYAEGEDGTESAVIRVELPAYQPVAPDVTAPTAKSLTYNGTAQELILAGSTTGGMMEYKLGNDGAYGTAVPTAINAGDYTVFYRVTGDDTYADAAEQSVSVTIEKATVTATAKSYEIYVNDKAPDLSAPVAGEHYTLFGLAAADVLDGTAVLSYRKDGQTVMPDVTKAGAYDIVLSGITEPAGGNYQPIVLQAGTLTISNRPSSGGSGSHSGSSTPTHAVSAGKAANGSVSLNTARAAQGSRVTITVKPDAGYQLASLTVRDGNGNAVAVTKQTETTYTFTMPAGKVSVDASFAAIQTAISFRDVKQGDYFYDAVQWAVEKGITEGTGADTFSPNASCTRAQMVTFLWRAAGSPAPKSAANPFRDVRSTDYYYGAVLWAVENGITSGTGADTFSPTATVIRGQTVTFLYRAAGSPGGNGNSSFSDVNKNDYYNSAVLWAAQNGITTGTGDGRFSPGADCTRAQIVTLLFRANEGN